MKYLICNLKAHKTYEEILLYRDYLRNIEIKNTKLILAPGNVYLPVFRNENISLCAQDFSLKEELELNGDITLKQLKSLNTKYVIIGHYERRKYYQENEYQIKDKIIKALNNKIKVIYCIGETLEELNRKVEYQALERGIARILNYVPRELFKNIIIAYEPCYLIGNQIEINVEKVATTISFIKKLIRDYYDAEIDIVFGGNINNDNIKDFKKINNLDGYIISTSILNPANIPIILNQ